MKGASTLPRVGSACWVAFLLLFGLSRAAAETGPEGTSINVAPAEVAASNSETNIQAQLLEAYIRLQAQLNEAQLAIERNRAQYQESARKQASDIGAKLTAIQEALNADQADQYRQREELRKSNQTILWMAGAFGIAGMLAMLFTAISQWRTMNRVAEITAWRPQLLAAPANSMLPAETDLAGGKVVELSNQRLMAVIERLEKRVFELEHSTVGSNGKVDLDEAALDSEAGPAARINALLGKGQSLMNAGQTEEALKCYDEILKLEPSQAEALVKKGAALERLEQNEEALRCYDLAIEADRSLTIAYLYKGGIYNRLERYNEALECYEQALRAQGQPA